MSKIDTNNNNSNHNEMMMHTKVTTVARSTNTSTRFEFMNQIFKISILASSTTATTTNANAEEEEQKLYNLSSEEIAQIVTKDIVQNSFLTNGKLTRSIYDEKATFTDEIDTYTLPQWIKGTSQLFVPPSSDDDSTGSSSSNNNKKKGSRVGLVGDVKATNDKIEFSFEEDLVFNIPFKPIVFVSGKVILERDKDSGLITSYREFWDQDVATVLKSARF